MPPFVLSGSEMVSAPLVSATSLSGSVMRMLVVQVEGIDIFEGLKDRPFPFIDWERQRIVSPSVALLHKSLPQQCRCGCYCHNPDLSRLTQSPLVSMGKDPSAAFALIQLPFLSTRWLHTCTPPKIRSAGRSKYSLLRGR
jgi:hypothetical protein